MRIGIDISQIQYSSTGVSEYLVNLVNHLINIDKKNEYILFFSSLRKNFQSISANWRIQSNQKVLIKQFKFPQTVLNLFWNKFHILPIEWFIGDVDIFVSSDWTQPPTTKAKKATIVYDLIVYKNPEETDKKIVDVQKRRLEWVKKDCDVVFCISESSKKDAMEILGIEEKKLKVIYPGI